MTVLAGLGQRATGGESKTPNLGDLAKQLIEQHTDGLRGLNFDGLAATINSISAQSPGLGALLRSAVLAHQTPLQSGKQLEAGDQFSKPEALAGRPSIAPTEVRLDPKALGFSEAQFAAAMDKSHSPETRAQIARMWSDGKNLPRVVIADLKTANATFDPSAGPNGTITLNAKLMRSTDMSAGFGSFAAWGVMEEVGHWADRQAHILSGNAKGQTTGDEGARFAHVMQASLPKNGDGFNGIMTLGTANG